MTSPPSNSAPPSRTRWQWRRQRCCGLRPGTTFFLGETFLFGTTFLFGKAFLLGTALGSATLLDRPAFARGDCLARGDERRLGRAERAVLRVDGTRPCEQVFGGVEVACVYRLTGLQHELAGGRRRLCGKLVTARCVELGGHGLDFGAIGNVEFARRRQQIRGVFETSVAHGDPGGGQVRA